MENQSIKIANSLMNIQSQHWVALAQPPSKQENCYQFMQTFDNNLDSGVFALIAEVLPSSHSNSEHSLPHQRSQQGAKLAIQASRQAFEDLLDRQLDFETFFLDLLAKCWQNLISQHFTANPISELEGQPHETPTASAKNSLSLFPSLYDTTINIVRLTEQQLMVYQIGYSQLLLLNQQHEISIIAPEIDPLTPFTQFLCHPKLKEAYPCQLINIAESELEMLILLSKQQTAHRTQQHLKDEAFTLSRLIDTKGGADAQQYLGKTQENACKIIIKRNRRWYNGLSSALDRDSHYFHQKLGQQSHHIHQLETEIQQLRQTTQQMAFAQELQVQEKDQQRYISSQNFTQELKIEQHQEKIKLIPLTLVFSTLALLASSLAVYSLWRSQSVKKNMYPHERVKSEAPTQRSKHTPHLEISKIDHKKSDILPTALLTTKPTTLSSATTETTETTKNRQILEQSRLEKIQQQTIAQQIINYSTTFAEHALRLNKKEVEIKIMNELLSETKNNHYSQQLSLLEKRRVKLNQKMQNLSQEYSQQLKRLCDYSQPYIPTSPAQASPLEKIALRHLKQQLRDCAQANTTSATLIGKKLRRSYQQLDVED